MSIFFRNRSGLKSGSSPRVPNARKRSSFTTPRSVAGSAISHKEAQKHKTDFTLCDFAPFCGQQFFSCLFGDTFGQSGLRSVECPSKFLAKEHARACSLHVDGPIAQSVEQLAFNQWVAGSSPARLTTNISNLGQPFDMEVAAL